MFLHLVVFCVSSFGCVLGFYSSVGVLVSKKVIRLTEEFQHLLITSAETTCLMFWFEHLLIPSAETTCPMFWFEHLLTTSAETTLASCFGLSTYSLHLPKALASCFGFSTCILQAHKPHSLPIEVTTCLGQLLVSSSCYFATLALDGCCGLVGDVSEQVPFPSLLCRAPW